MIWLLSQLWVFGLIAFIAGLTLTWFTVVQSRTVRAHVPVDRTHAAHASSGSTKAVGSSLDELADEDVYAAAPQRRPADRSVGAAMEPRHGEWPAEAADGGVQPHAEEAPVDRSVGAAMESRRGEPQER